MHLNLLAMYFFPVFWLSTAMIFDRMAGDPVKERGGSRNEQTREEWIASPRYHK